MNPVDAALEVKAAAELSNLETLLVPRTLLDLTGDMVVAVFLAKALEWQARAGKGVWWSKSAPEWWDAIRYKRSTQERCRGALKCLGVLEQELRGQAQGLFYRVNEPALANLVRETRGSQ